MHRLTEHLIMSSSVNQAFNIKHLKAAFGNTSRYRDLCSLQARNRLRCRALHNSGLSAVRCLRRDANKRVNVPGIDRPRAVRHYLSRGISSNQHIKMNHRAFIALGSNIGNRLNNIEKACRLMESDGSIAIRRNSGLWETAAMYVIDQPSFYNGVCEIQTNLSPLELLDRLQYIEIQLGRQNKMDKGPRTIDLDILLYDDTVFEHKRLSIPHQLMLDREFVLRPLCELIPAAPHPAKSLHISFSEHLKKITDPKNPLSTITPLSPHLPPLTPLLSSRRTHIMSIMNLTPDSFSDGGLHNTSNPSSLSTTLEAHHLAGASIIDIGGQSSRPHAEPISADEEIGRILPSIEILTALTASEPSLPKPAPAISVDTYRATVAAAAVAAGADIVNDISAGTLDPAMLPTVARLGCTVVLMHMRGDPTTMTRAEHTTYPDGVVAGVASELLERVAAAERAGVRRWRIMLDPGIGFAKTGAQNVELLRRFAELRAWDGLQGLPWVVGTSRKGFIGRITGVQDAARRGWGTAATVAAAVQGGADVVRVHDVREMGEVVRMSDAIWRV